MATAEIKSRATLDDKQFGASIAGMQQKVKSFASGEISQLGGIITGAFAIGSLVSFGKQLYETADQAQKASAKLGITASEYQSLQMLARETETNFGTLESAIYKMAKAQTETLAGNKSLQASFEMLGVSMAQLKMADKPALLQMLSRELSINGNQASIAAASYDIFGRGAEQLSAILSELGQTTLPALSQQMQDANLVPSDEETAKLAAFADEWERMADRLKAAATPVLIELNEFFSTIAYGWKQIGALGMDIISPGSAERAAQKGVGGDTETTAANAAKVNDAKVAAAQERRNAVTARAIEAQERAEDWKIKMEQAKDDNAEALLEGVDVIDRTPQASNAPNAPEVDIAAGLQVNQPQASDYFARMGIMVGGQSSPFQNIAERQAQIIEKLAAYDEKHGQRMEELTQAIVTTLEVG